MNNGVFGKTMENMKKHMYWTCHNRKKKKSYYKTFDRMSISNRNEKTQILVNKPVYLGLSILELSKILMYEVWHDYVKPKYGEKSKLCYMDIGSFIVYIKTDDIYKDIAQDV